MASTKTTPKTTAKKSTVPVKRCKESLEDVCDSLLDSLFVAVADPMEDIYSMAVKAKAALEQKNIAQAARLLNGIVEYIDDFLAEDEEDEDCDCCDCDDEEDDEVEEIELEVDEDDEDDEPAPKPKKRGKQ